MSADKLKTYQEMTDYMKAEGDVLKKELESLVIGKEFLGFQSNFHSGEAVAVGVYSSGLTDPECVELIPEPMHWMVLMKEKNGKTPDRDFDYSIEVSTFLDKSIIDELFKKHFGDLRSEDIRHLKYDEKGRTIEISIANWHMALPQAIEDSKPGDTIHVHNQAMLELAESAKARLRPGKYIHFKIVEPEFDSKIKAGAYLIHEKLKDVMES